MGFREIGREIMRALKMRWHRSKWNFQREGLYNSDFREPKSLEHFSRDFIFVFSQLSLIAKMKLCRSVGDNSFGLLLELRCGWFLRKGIVFMSIDGSGEFENALISMEYYIITHLVAIKTGSLKVETATREVISLRRYADAIEEAAKLKLAELKTLAKAIALEKPP